MRSYFFFFFLNHIGHYDKRAYKKELCIHLDFFCSTSFQIDQLYENTKCNRLKYTEIREGDIENGRVES